MNNLKLKGKVLIDGMEFNQVEGGFGKAQKSMLVKDIADIHDRQLREINERINLNRTRFKDGIDIMDLRGTEFEIGLTDNGIYTQNAINRSKNIYLLSERGYAKLLKILEDDFAWEQYDKLVDNYFNMREKINQTSKLPSKISKQDLIKQEKENLDKAVTTSNYLISYISSANGQVSKDILDSFTTIIQAVNIDIIAHIRNINRF